MAEPELVYEPEFPDRETIQAAFKQLFGEEKGKWVSKLPDVRIYDADLVAHFLYWSGIVAIVNEQRPGD